MTIGHLAAYILPMVFRPLPLLTLCALPALALLIWLGSWQLDRAQSKHQAIADWQALASAAPITLEAAFCQGSAQNGVAIDTPALSPALTPAPNSVKIYGRDPSGQAGWRVFAPLALPECAGSEFILIETGFFPIHTDQVIPLESTRLERPARPGVFTPVGNPDTGEFYAFDSEGIGEHIGLDGTRLNEAFWIVPDTGTLPPQLSQTPPERHYGYAATWFGLALTLIGVYLALHLRLGRLVFQRG